MNAIHRRRLLIASAALAAGSAARANPAATRPDRVATIVVPYPPGGSTDILARSLQGQPAGWGGQTVVLDYKPGAGGLIGAAFVARSPADSHRVLLATQPILSITPHMNVSMGFDPLKDLVPLTNGVNAVLGVAVHPALPVSNLAELAAYSRRNPGTVSFGSAGVGSPQHVGGVLLGQRAGIDWRHVGYKGGAPMNADLLAGHIQAGIATMSIFKPYIADRRLKVLAVGEPRRYAGTPDIPTMAETVPGFELSTWLAFFGASSMPADQIAWYSQALRETLNTPEVVARMSESGLIIDAQGPEHLARMVSRDYELYGKVIRDNGITNG